MTSESYTGHPSPPFPEFPENNQSPSLAFSKAVCIHSLHQGRFTPEMGLLCEPLHATHPGLRAPQTLLALQSHGHQDHSWGSHPWGSVLRDMKELATSADLL